MFVYLRTGETTKCRKASLGPCGVSFFGRSEAFQLSKMPGHGVTFRSSNDIIP